MNKVVAMIFAVALVSCVRAKETKSAEALSSEVTVLLEAGDTLQAIKVLEEFNKNNPDFKNSHGYTIMLNHSTKQITTEEGRKQMNALFGSDSTNDMMMYFQYRKIEEENDFDAAVVALEK